MNPDIPPQRPEDYAWFTYLWVIVFSGLGGYVSFMRKLKKGHARAFNIAEFFGEVATSAFVGVITFFICENYHIPPLMTAAFVGITGHMGSRALFQLEQFFSNRFPAPTKEPNE